MGNINHSKVRQKPNPREDRAGGGVSEEAQATILIRCNWAVSLHWDTVEKNKRQLDHVVISSLIVDVTG